MHSNRIEKLLVVDDDFHCVGLITVKDMEKAQLHPDACKDEHGRLRVAAATGVGDKGVIAPSTFSMPASTLWSSTPPMVIRRMCLKPSGGSNAEQCGSGGGRKCRDGGSHQGPHRCRRRCVKIGIGPGSICTTRIVAGVGVPQLSAIMDCVSEADKSGVPVVADGGIKYSGDLAKAIAAGANCAMIGSLFAGTDESPGEVFLYQGRSYKAYRGMGSVGAMARGSADRYFQQDIQETLKLVPEGIEGQVPYKGPLGACCTSWSAACGPRWAIPDAEHSDFRSKAEFIKITSASLRESHVHDVTITRESPNYPTGSTREPRRPPHTALISTAAMHLRRANAGGDRGAERYSSIVIARPADALRDWGRSHRFAGSGDRAVIGNLVFDCLRRRRSLAARLGDDAIRLAVLGVAVFLGASARSGCAELCAVTTDLGPERGRTGALPNHHGDDSEVRQGRFPGLAGAVAVPVPSVRILDSPDRSSVGAGAGRSAGQHAQGRTRQGARGTVRFDAVETPWSPWGCASPRRGRARYPNLEAEAGHGKGWFEVQDEGSQSGRVACRRSAGFAGHGSVCRGRGQDAGALPRPWKTRARSTLMTRDRNRLRKIFERLKRAGARNVQVMEAGNEQAGRALEGRMDVVLIDAPCSGSGTWRRTAGCQMAPQRRGAGSGACRATRRPGTWRAADQARRPAGLCDLLAAAGGKSRIRFSLSAGPPITVVPAISLAGSRMASLPETGAEGRITSTDPANPRNRWFLHSP